MTTQVHIVSIISAFIGHIRPALGFVTALVDRHPEVIYTVLAFLPQVQTVHQEIKNSGIPESASSRIRVVGVSTVDPGAGLDAIPVGLAELTKHVPEAYKLLAACGNVTCTSTGTVYDYSGIPPPSLVLIDSILPYAAPPIKETTPGVKLLVFWIATAGVFGSYSGPKRWAGNYSWIEDTEEAMKLDPSKPFDEVAEKVLCAFSGEVKTNAEGISFHDYELYPQQQPPSGMTRLHIDTTRLPTGPVADGIVIASTETFEPKTSKLVLRQWYEGELGKKAYFVGPGAVHLFRSPESTIIEPKYKHVFDFLDAQPTQSVWLISFGTMYYPFLHPNHIEVMLKTLLKCKTPFILSRAAALAFLAPLPTELVEEVERSGLGLIVDFLPQKEALRHSSVGAFVTHGGVNSAFETVVCGEGRVLPVFWPMSIDQPMMAMHMSQSRDCAFELIQVRTGPGGGPSFYGGVVHGTEEAIALEIEGIVADLKGEVGDRKRRNLGVVGAELKDAAKVGGDIENALQELVDVARN